VGKPLENGADAVMTARSMDVVTMLCFYKMFQLWVI
jgi:hypothetical protein